MSFYFFNSLYSFLAGLGFAFGCSKPFQSEIRKFFGKDTSQFKPRLKSIKLQLKGYKIDAKSRRVVIKDNTATYNNSPKVIEVINKIDTCLEEHKQAADKLNSEKEFKESTHNFSTIAFCSALLATFFLVLGAITRDLDPIAKTIAFETVFYIEIVYLLFIAILFLRDLFLVKKAVTLRYGLLIVFVLSCLFIGHYCKQGNAWPLFEYEPLADLSLGNINVPLPSVSLSNTHNATMINRIIYLSPIILVLHYLLYFARTMVYIPLFYRKEKAIVEDLEKKLPQIELSLSLLKSDSSCIIFSAK